MREKLFPPHAAMARFERNVARRMVTAPTVTRRQYIPASLHLAATTDLQPVSTVPDPM